MDGPSGNLASAIPIRAAEPQGISRQPPDSTSELLVALQLRVGELKSFVSPGATKQILDEVAETLQNIDDSMKQIGM